MDQALIEMPPAEAAELSNRLASEEYNRQRSCPQRKDELYVHLSDVRLFLGDYCRESFCQLLDYGCGGSPYKTLFNTKRYIRADYVNSRNIDLRIGEDGRLGLPDSSVDVVLSTQVLEHVFSPQKYLSEAFRVLSPGGRLILTTHGIWEDHGCPYDFRRWTANGLELELITQGFQVTRAAKLTTGARAAVFLLGQRYGQLFSSRRNLTGLLFWLLWKRAFANLEYRHAWIDARFANCRMVDAKLPGHDLYLALGIEGRKPL
jgi:SAM-dependent methyltransferase